MHLAMKLASVEQSSTWRLHTLGRQIPWNIKPIDLAILPRKDPVLADRVIGDQLVDQEMGFTFLIGENAMRAHAPANKFIIIRTSEHSSRVGLRLYLCSLCYRTSIRVLTVFRYADSGSRASNQFPSLEKVRKWISARVFTPRLFHPSRQRWWSPS